MRKHLLFALMLTFGCCSIQAQRGKNASILSSELVQLNQSVDSLAVLTVKRKPLIGISSETSPKRICVNAAYTQSVILAGGIPYVIPVTDNVEVLRQIVSQLDGIVFTGGEDIQPIYYKEQPNEKLEEVCPERDTFDLILMKLATDRNVPILGICRGLQLMNVAFGGTLYQDLPTQHPSDTNHRQKVTGTTPTHTVSLIPNSKIAEVLGQTELPVNTFHHQAVKQLAPGFKITGCSPDNVVEAIEAYPTRQIIGVQFHPEIFTAAGDTLMRKLFHFLVNEADTFRMTEDKNNKK